jgi:hypothetical protein
VAPAENQVTGNSNDCRDSETDSWHFGGSTAMVISVVAISVFGLG